MNTERQMMHLRPLYGWQSPRVLPSRRYRSPKVPVMSFHCSSGCAVRQPKGHSYYTRAYSSCQISGMVQVGNCLQRICRSKATGWTVQCYRRSFSSKRFMGPSYAAPITFIYLLYLHNILPAMSEHNRSWMVSFCALWRASHVNLITSLTANSFLTRWCDRSLPALRKCHKPYSGYADRANGWDKSSVVRRPTPCWRTSAIIWHYHSTEICWSSSS